MSNISVRKGLMQASVFDNCLYFAMHGVQFEQASGFDLAICDGVGLLETKPSFCNAWLNF